MKLNLFQKSAIITVISTVGVILMGSLVRASGAGLGCPDWPRCFGMWIPPMTAAELPPQYDATLFNPLHTWLEYINRLTGADRKSTRLNSSHVAISYAVFCLKKKNKNTTK